jgi:phosphopentomutase
VIVLDAVGAGDLPDAELFGTAGSNTLGHVAEAVGGLDVPSLQQLGLGNVMPLVGCAPRADAPSVQGRLVERSLGMDTTTGHWEMMGIITERPFPTYPNGFPQEVIDEFARRTGRGVLGNHPASGTEIIKELGEEHQRSGDWIVYTSADSVFQIAAHEQTVPLDELYAASKTAREMLTGEHAVGRVIARPFEGEPGAYVRTPRRHDFSLLPPRPNHLQRLREAGATVHGVGKIFDIFAGQDIDTSAPTESNAQGIARTIDRLRNAPDKSLIFTNLVETDMIWGHRNDPEGFADSLREFDEELPRLLTAMNHGDLLILTSDHGCDPTTPSTDHSREHGLLLAHVAGGPVAPRRHDGATFADVGATVQRHLTGSHDQDLPGTPVL